VLTEINTQLPAMHYETSLCLTQGLLARSKRDQRFLELLHLLDNKTFQEAQEELPGEK
jgi:hypothetical protein